MNTETTALDSTNTPEIGLVSSIEELRQIHELNRKYIRGEVLTAEEHEEGFLTWLYDSRLLQQMQEQAPSVIAKDRDRVVAYALTTLRQACDFHQNLRNMFEFIERLPLDGKPLGSQSFYVMGQVCVDKPYRGRNLIARLYEKHREVYSHQFDYLVTEISTRNIRSLKAHQKIGFRIIHTYPDALDEWNVVAWKIN
ncbi:MAG TPA: GNAT family N-acetyltransferase [Flavisolibacter sp.]|jgi:GNAT superfamily N-acetyltransferase|nr:GNAT family N-acetyltransferase [Flavisolibacter sp.]